MDLTPHYPVFLALDGRLAVVVGGNAAGERKVRGLLRCGAKVRVVAAEVTPALAELRESGDITVEPRGYVRGDLEGAELAFAVTGDAEVDRAVFNEAQERGVLVNVHDAPELCTFVTPSVVHRGPFQIAVSTAGAAPAVASRVRRDLAAEYGPEWAVYVTLLGQVRTLAMMRVDDPARRKAMLDAAAGSDLLERIAAGEQVSAEDAYVVAMRASEEEAAS
jgi:precorrin-2 dehydrogenase / sirohydrochlorin ferrochelatase